MAEKGVTPGDAAEALREHVDFLDEVTDSNQRITLLGKVCEQYGGCYRGLGICALSGEGDVESFFHFLIQSAVTRRHYLVESRKAGGGEAYHRRASFVEPVLDAMATRQWKLLEAIFAEVSHDFMEGEEYEDDFAYAEFLRREFSGARDVDALFERWEEVLEGGADPRLDVARALHARDAAAFDETLRALLASVDSRQRAMLDPETGSALVEEPTFFPNRWVSVEGLALLAFAERLGIPVEGEYPGCPALVRGQRVPPFFSRGFPNASYVSE
jgi:hypothetical protein